MKREYPPEGRIVIPGGTGFPGLNLARRLSQLGCDVVLLSRHSPAEKGAWQHECWDGRSAGLWVRQLDGAAAVVNLARRTVDCIKTPDHCDEILRSRVEATTAPLPGPTPSAKVRCFPSAQTLPQRQAFFLIKAPPISNAG